MPLLRSSLPTLVWLYATLILFGTPLSADEKIVENPLKAKASLATSQVAPGSQTTLNIDLELVPEHKAYVDMFKIKWKTPKDTKISGLSANPSFKFEDKFSGSTREGVKDNARLTALVEFPDQLEFGSQNYELDFTYQACTETYCHFPKTIKLNVPVTVVRATELVPGEAPSSFMENSLTSALNRGKLYAFLFVFLAGVLTSLTPCIFPMIPITLAIIGARAANQTKFKSFSLSLVYVLGIALTYAILGVLAARTGALFGSYLGHPVVVGAIAAIFVAMGLSMYGLYDLQVPYFITRRLAGGKASAGYVGAFTTGLLAGVIASPCVGPVLVGILTYVAESQDLFLGFSLLFTFALGIGQLFLWLGTFSGLLQKMPKSGPWMEFVKFLFGTVMIGAAIWYIRPVVPERALYAIIAVTLVMISSGFGVFEKAHASKLSQMKKGSLVLMMVVGLAYGARAVFYNQLPAATPAQISKLDWKPYSDKALADAKRDKKPVIIDFWAEWCVACKELEAFTFSQPNVRDLSKDFVLLKLDATNSNELVDRLMKQYGVIGLPTVLFYNPSGKLNRSLTLTGFENATEFEKRMRKALQD